MRIMLFTLALCLSSFVMGDETDTCFTSSPIPSHISTSPVPTSELRYLRLSYRDAEGATQTGEMICSKTIADDLTDIFRELWKSGYRIERMRLMQDYEGDDERSMEDNNTSCFNYRTIAGTQRLSMHARGLAVDVNPLYNPYVKNGKVSPKRAGKWAWNRSRRKDIPYKIDHEDLCYKLFRKHGFQWGGDWRSCKDYQHFEKTE